ncbi:MAG: hypothetical protein ABI361_14295 [Nitrososphaera sp.]
MTRINGRSSRAGITVLASALAVLIVIALTIRVGNAQSHVSSKDRTGLKQ